MGLNFGTPDKPAVAKKPTPPPEGKKDSKPTTSAPTISSTDLLKIIAKDRGPKLAMLATHIEPIQRQRTGIFELDLQLGGGLPKGCLTIIYGTEGSCKTLVFYKTCAEIQMEDPNARGVLVDLEGSHDSAWAARCGVDLDRLIVISPSYGEEAADMVDTFLRADDVAILGVDSFAMLIASKEIEQSAEKFDVGTSALLIKRMCNKMMIALADRKKQGQYPVVIGINQIRYKIGVMFGDPETTPGGQTPKFLAFLILRFSAKNLIVDAVNATTHAMKTIKVTVKKARCGVLSNSFEFNQVIIPHNGMGVGDTNSWATVKNFLQQMGHLQQVKNPNGKGEVWEVNGMYFPKLGDIQELYLGDHEFRSVLQKTVTDGTTDKLKSVQLAAPDPKASQVPGVANLLFSKPPSKEAPDESVPE